MQTDLEGNEYNEPVLHFNFQQSGLSRFRLD